MNKPLLAVLGAILVASGFVGINALFTVDQTEQAIIFQFGEPKRVIQEPGLNVKIPFVQNVVYFDRRILNLDPAAEEVILSDQKRIDVDAFARYRIVDPLLFYQTVRSEIGILDRLGRILTSSLRSELGRVPLDGLLTSRRHDIMNSVRTQVNESGKSFGIEVVDVRIGRTELPEQISKTVFDRMRSERIREANLLRAEGDEIRQTITSEADRTATVILAQATSESSARRGNGDGERNRILVEAFGKDQEFFSFYRSMIAYRRVLQLEDTTLVLSPDSEFLRYFGSFDGKAGTR